MLVQFLATAGLLILLLGAVMATSGIFIFWKHRKNGALFLGTLLVLFGLAILLLASKMNAPT